jgi:glycosyltransferase involved in cell wall biosynthesis
MLETLLKRGMRVDFVGSSEHEGCELLEAGGVSFLNLRDDTDASASIGRKVIRQFRYYSSLIGYATTTDAGVFHILWANRFLLLDRVLLMAYYKLLGKKIVLTAHNINERQRDGRDSLYNHETLRVFYRLCDHILVHTEKMKTQLSVEFGVKSSSVSVIPFGINNTVPTTEITRTEARKHLGLDDGDKVVLFFGRIARYKGLDRAVDALCQLRQIDKSYRLVVAGRVDKGHEEYWKGVERAVGELELESGIITHIRHIPEVEVEDFFKAADVLVLPYRDIFQSGVLFLGYSFGVPVVATDVGSFKEDVVAGVTGFMSDREDSAGIARAIARYFASELFEEREVAAEKIRAYGNRRHSWDEVGQTLGEVYGCLSAAEPLASRVQ